jgi:hypothetical protein
MNLSAFTDSIADTLALRNHLVQIRNFLTVFIVDTATAIF